jgi:hypothetical protein
MIYLSSRVHGTISQAGRSKQTFRETSFWQLNRSNALIPRVQETQRGVDAAETARARQIVVGNGLLTRISPRPASKPGGAEEPEVERFHGSL